MNPAVEKWFRDNEMADLVPVFARQKLFTFRLLKGLTSDLLREFIPEIGVRINFMQSIKVLDESPNLLSELRTEPLVDQQTDSEEIDDDLDIDGSEIVDEHGNPIVVMKLGENSTSECFTPDPPLKKRRVEVSTPISRQGKENRKTIQDFKSLLKEDVFTSHVLETYELSGDLSDQDRGYIVAVAAKYLLNLTPRVTSLAYNCMADKVIEIFPHENKVRFYSDL
ncbi:hypothetical protein KUF71_016885, partial [Frankliniella fusca]